MRKAMLFLAMFALAGSLRAADPIIGTWKLNVAKSIFSSVYLALRNREAPKVGAEIYQTYRELDSGQITYGKYTWPQQGGAATVSKDSPSDFIQTLIAPGEWLITVLQDGKQIGIIHKVISKDGKTMTQTYRGVYQDKPYEHVDVFDRR